MTTDPTPTPVSVTPVTEDRTVAILSYLTIIGFIVAIVMHGNKKTKLGAFHLRQVLGLFITGVVFWPCSIILAFIPILGWLALFIGWIGLLVFVVMGFIAAATGKEKAVPILGKYYQKWFSGTFN